MRWACSHRFEVYWKITKPGIYFLQLSYMQTLCILCTPITLFGFNRVEIYILNCVCVCVYVSVYICVCVYMCMCVYMCVCVYVCMYVCSPFFATSHELVRRRYTTPFDTVSLLAKFYPIFWYVRSPYNENWRFS